MAQQSARRGRDNQGFPLCFEHASGDLDPVRELPYRPAAVSSCRIEAGQMTASDHAQQRSQRFPLRERGRPQMESRHSHQIPPGAEWLFRQSRNGCEILIFSTRSARHDLLWSGREGRNIAARPPERAEAEAFPASCSVNYSITSSACARIKGGTVMPSAAAVLRLTTR